MKIAGILVVVAAAFCMGFLIAKSEVRPDVKAFDFKTATNDDVSLQIICSEFRLQAARNRVNAELQTSNQGTAQFLHLSPGGGRCSILRTSH
jgi:hypothetical protein